MRSIAPKHRVAHDDLGAPLTNTRTIEHTAFFCFYFCDTGDRRRWQAAQLAGADRQRLAPPDGCGFLRGGPLGHHGLHVRRADTRPGGRADGRGHGGADGGAGRCTGECHRGREREGQDFYGIVQVGKLII